MEKKRDYERAALYWQDEFWKMKAEFESEHATYKAVNELRIELLKENLDIKDKLAAQAKIPCSDLSEALLENANLRELHTKQGDRISQLCLNNVGHERENKALHRRIEVLQKANETLHEKLRKVP